MKKKLNIGNVSYINSKPFAFGFQHYPNHVVDFNIVSDTPNNLAAMLEKQEIDVGILPLAFMSNRTDVERISNYGIASDGRVESVLLLSNYELNEIESLVLDADSQTSNRLAMIVLQRFYGRVPNILNTVPKDPQLKYAVVRIGDKAMSNNNTYTHAFDLPECWKQHTGLPFVFAVWAAKKGVLEDEVLFYFNEAIKYGVQRIDALLNEQKGLIQYEHYLKNCIKYELTEDYFRSADLFMTYLEELKSTLKI